MLGVRPLLSGAWSPDNVYLAELAWTNYSWKCVEWLMGMVSVNVKYSSVWCNVTGLISRAYNYQHLEYVFVSAYQRIFSTAYGAPAQTSTCNFHCPFSRSLLLSRRECRYQREYYLSRCKCPTHFQLPRPSQNQLHKPMACWRESLGFLPSLDEFSLGPLLPNILQPANAKRNLYY